IAAGKGIQGKEHVGNLERLAGLLGGMVAGSRAAVEAGWISVDRQVGQTGKSVSPRLYIACGISGQIQHTSGMNHVETVIAINNDPDAPIFEMAHYGIVGNAQEIVPELIQILGANV
ncbi:MAG: electron transfer flavoprotein subunit alpha/FixB family protein, partial [Tannerellaceae bacterium]